ncbi:hypothetical protein TVAG_237500 [Trichomonas vaginalis G3]|uniref:Uncharacterized protein n=1 Tax=Trichomonas vaginalis (strain ATCC PRA-98 / G3) TaxID=412133 RepID=A2DCV0_TRIV3|nr:hypothetical protein TVAGG3_0606780 [Trichomonas vaginalis G3]EAY21724.1 hypothetical protein TVAG_237500 [Trichomonas vaginalis G3]KAI5524303.1 hypothetical protein TVAGG3_0606780 [Trichomonas vaginalis G3]|eukprot:XP_001582710.1 hypothetical protein [Trichomonas vaginalis G3]
MFDTTNPGKEIAIFGVEFIIKGIKFINFAKNFPSLSVVFEDGKDHTLLPFTDEASEGTIWKLNKKKRFIFSSNAFKAVKLSKMTIDLNTPTDPFPPASITYDLTPFLCDSIAVRGPSSVVEVDSIMKDLMYQKDVIEIEFDLRTIYFSNCIKLPTVSGNVGPLPRFEVETMRQVNSGTFGLPSKSLAATDYDRRNARNSRGISRVKTTFF